MRPLKLKFKGINSFSDQTEIDFEKLTKSGLFGIFGDTGSGKSTILDCISFALFGKIERSREKLDIINYRSDSAEVHFEFDVLADGKRKKYTVERSLRKKSGLHKAMLYEDGLCIADNASGATKKITEVLGVDADDFCKCIALPQGEFSQFVKSQPSERIALIERLFSLYKYGNGLKERIKERETDCNLRYGALSAKLSAYSDVSAKIVEELSEQSKKTALFAETLNSQYVEAEKEFVSLKSLGEKRSELDDAIKKLNELSLRKNTMDVLRERLKVLPLCNRIVETDNEVVEKRQKLKAASNKVSELNKDLESEKSRLNEYNIRAEKADYDNEITRRVALSAAYSACSGKAEKLTNLENSLIALRENYKKTEEKLSLLENSAKLAQAEVDKCENTLKNYATSNLDYIINVECKGAFLRDEYVNSLDYFVGLNGQLQYFKDNSELFAFITRELKQQITSYKERVYSVKDFNLAKVQRQLEKMQSLSEEKDKLSAVFIEKKGLLKDAEAAVAVCKNELGIIKRDGVQIRAQADELKTELVKAFGENCKDYAAAERINKEEIERLKTEKANTERAVQKSTLRIAELNAQLAAKGAEIKSLTEDIQIFTEKLSLLLSQAGFESVDVCKKFVSELGEAENAESALAEYDKKVLTLTERKSGLEKTEGIQTFTFERLKDSENLRNIAKEKLSETRERLAVINSEYARAVERLKEKAVIERDFSACEKERNLIAQLKEITRGNRFMEYIANEYLYDISKLASSTLLNLTDGRYFLTYTDTFYAGDNFNGGSLRGVNTLSGGETFLVSLSLALALSQTICARSLKSIEFFFLDEGFGTLDSTLVETVMVALEKLKSSNFTIGVISHVEELKHRIDSKITVNKATGSHGSTVQISC